MSALIHAALVSKDHQERVQVASKETNNKQDYHFYSLELVYHNVTLVGIMTIQQTNVNYAIDHVLHAVALQKIAQLVDRVLSHSFIRIIV